MSTPTSPEDFAALLRQYAGAIGDPNNVNSILIQLQNDTKHQNTAQIEAQLKNEINNLTTLQGEISAALQGTDSASDQDALSAIMSNIGLSLVYLSRSMGALQGASANPDDYKNALDDLQVTTSEGGPGATGALVSAYYAAYQWSEAQIQDAINSYNTPGNQTAAGAALIQKNLQALENYLATMSPADAAGALGLSPAQYTSYTNALASALSDANNVAAKGGPMPTNNWNAVTQIIQFPDMPPPATKKH